MSVGVAQAPAKAVAARAIGISCTSRAFVAARVGHLRAFLDSTRADCPKLAARTPFAAPFSLAPQKACAGKVEVCAKLCEEEEEQRDQKEKKKHGIKSKLYSKRQRMTRPWLVGGFERRADAARKDAVELVDFLPCAVAL